MISAICVSCRDEVAKAIRRVIGDNGGNCKRKSLGAEPCPGCSYCDEEGNL